MTELSFHPNVLKGVFAKITAGVAKATSPGPSKRKKSRLVDERPLVLSRTYSASSIPSVHSSNGRPSRDDFEHPQNTREFL